jgi:hypothetical protein
MDTCKRVNKISTTMLKTDRKKANVRCATRPHGRNSSLPPLPQPIV